MVLLSVFAFLCPPMWSHDENVNCPHLYHVIMGSYTLIVGVLKYFLILGGFVRFDSYPFRLLYYGAFVHYCFSLSYQVIAWWECWLSTPVSCDHGIVHLDCWSIKIFSHFWVLSALILILWFFRSMVLLSIFAFLCPPTSSHYENVGCPHLYQVIMGSYTLIFGVLKYFLIFGGLSALILILWFFRPMVLLSILLFSVRPCDHMMRILIVHTCIMWSWDRTPWLLEY